MLNHEQQLIAMSRENDALVDENSRLRAERERLSVLASLLTVRQVIEAGDRYIEAAGLNPWCINEGQATGDERLGLTFMTD